MSEKLEKHLEGINEERRSVLKKMVVGAAFAIPTITTFSIDGKSAAFAIPINTTYS